MDRPLNGRHGTSGVPTTVPIDNPESDSDDSHVSDSSSSVDSIHSEEINAQFCNRHGRLFHSHSNTPQQPYPLPVDDREIVRLESLHEVIKDILGGANYFGPFHETLGELSDGRRRRVVDLCTGSGKWIDEMTEEFPDVKFYGTDIASIATRYPASNAQYEIMDVNGPLRWVAGRIDVVHMRQASLAVTDYSSLLNEIGRILRPNGLLLSGEWSLNIFMEDGSDLRAAAPSLSEFFVRIMPVMHWRGLRSAAQMIPQILRANGHFVNVSVSEYDVPLDESERAWRLKHTIIEFGESFRPLLLDYGMTDAQIEELLENMHHDLDTVEGMHVRYLTVHARRTAS